MTLDLRATTFKKLTKYLSAKADAGLIRIKCGHARGDFAIAHAHACIAVAALISLRHEKICSACAVTVARRPIVTRP